MVGKRLVIALVLELAGIDNQDKRDSAAKNNNGGKM
jgi:hypothetical protein